MRRVDELTAADVHAHVPETAEEDEVGGLEVVVGDGTPKLYWDAAWCGSEIPICA